MRSSSVRAKVNAHGKNLLATATALGAVAGCTKSDSTAVETVSLPSASSTSAASAPSASATSPLASATATATASATASATATGTATVAVVPTGPPTHGYAVVDPMPPPSRCAGSASSAKATGTYVKSGADTVLKITVKLGGGSTWTGTPPTGYSGPVKSVTANASKDTVDVFLAPKDYGVTIPITCAAGKASLGISISGGSSPAPKVGDPVTLSVYDRY